MASYIYETLMREKMAPCFSAFLHYFIFFHPSFISAKLQVAIGEVWEMVGVDDVATFYLRDFGNYLTLRKTHLCKPLTAPINVLSSGIPARWSTGAEEGLLVDSGCKYPQPLKIPIPKVEISHSNVSYLQEAAQSAKH